MIRDKEIRAVERNKSQPALQIFHLSVCLLLSLFFPIILLQPNATETLVFAFALLLADCSRSIIPLFWWRIDLQSTQQCCQSLEPLSLAFLLLPIFSKWFTIKENRKLLCQHAPNFWGLQSTNVSYEIKVLQGVWGNGKKSLFLFAAHSTRSTFQMPFTLQFKRFYLAVEQLNCACAAFTVPLLVFSFCFYIKFAGQP